jgi:hypothetical protein
MCGKQTVPPLVHLVIHQGISSFPIICSMPRIKPQSLDHPGRTQGSFTPFTEVIAAFKFFLKEYIARIKDIGMKPMNRVPHCRRRVVALHI